MLSQKAENFHSKNHYYIFVALGNVNERPCFHIVPSKVVAEQIKANHSYWLNRKKKDGTKRKDSAMRKFKDDENKYLEAWKKINL